MRWDLGPLVPQGWLFPIEAVLLYLGATGSIVTAVRIAQSHLAETRPPDRQAQGQTRLWRLPRPWMLVTLLLLGFGIWILLQPMEMRGTMMMVTGG